MSKDTNLNRPKSTREAQGATSDLKEWIPLSVREARRARKMREDLWPYVWITFASVLILAAALAIMAYRIGAQSCR